MYSIPQDLTSSYSFHVTDSTDINIENNIQTFSHCMDLIERSLFYCDLSLPSILKIERKNEEGKITVTYNDYNNNKHTKVEITGIIILDEFIAIRINGLCGNPFVARMVYLRALFFCLPFTIHHVESLDSIYCRICNTINNSKDLFLTEGFVTFDSKKQEPKHKN